MVALYMDEHVPRAITRALRRRGVDVMTVQEDGHDHTPDAVILDRAGQIQRIVFTNDDDFLAEAKRRQEYGEHFIGVIYIHQENAKYGSIIDDLEIIAKASDLVDYSDRVQYLPL